MDQYEATSSDSKRTIHRRVDGMPQEESNVRDEVPEQDEFRRGYYNDNESGSQGKKPIKPFLPRDRSEREPMHLRSAVVQGRIEGTGAN